MHFVRSCWRPRRPVVGAGFHARPLFLPLTREVARRSRDGGRETKKISPPVKCCAFDSPLVRGGKNGGGKPPPYHINTNTNPNLYYKFITRTKRKKPPVRRLLVLYTTVVRVLAEVELSGATIDFYSAILTIFERRYAVQFFKRFREHQRVAVAAGIGNILNRIIRGL